MSRRRRWRELDLSRGVKHDHPDISEDKTYMVRFGGEWRFGRFSRQWYGWNFDDWGMSGRQFDTPGTNSSDWERIIELDPEEVFR